MKWYKDASKSAESDIQQFKKALKRHHPYKNQNGETKRRSTSPPTERSNSKDKSEPPRKNKKHSVAKIVNTIERIFPVSEAVDPSHFHVERKPSNRSPEDVEKDATKRRISELENEMKLLRSQVHSMSQQLSASKSEIHQLKLQFSQHHKPTPPTPHGNTPHGTPSSGSTSFQSVSSSAVEYGLMKMRMQLKDILKPSEFPTAPAAPPPPPPPPNMLLETRPFKPVTLPRAKSPSKAARRVSSSYYSSDSSEVIPRTAPAEMRSVLSEISKGSINLRAVPGERTPGRTAIKGSPQRRKQSDKENVQSTLARAISKKFANARAGTDSPTVKAHSSKLELEAEEPDDVDMVNMVFTLGDNYETM